MTSHPTRTTTPLGIKVLSALVVVDGLLFILGALTSLGGGGMPLLVLGVGLGLVQIAVAVGLWMLEPYAWGAAMFVLATTFVTEVAFGNLGPAALSGGIAAYLLLKKDLYET